MIIGHPIWCTNVGRTRLQPVLKVVAEIHSYMEDIHHMPFVDIASPVQTISRNSIATEVKHILELSI